MKKLLGIVVILFTVIATSVAQKKNEEKESKKNIKIPAAVRSAFTAKYPNAAKVVWEKEEGNYEANWGGKEGEDNSVQFTPSGNFIEVINLIPVSKLPAPVISYVKAHYKGARITEAGKVTDAKGKIFYEAEVNRKDILFDEKGNFIKSE
jgi:hypothetical protein